MRWADTIVECLKDADISLIAYVPDISIHQVTRLMEEDDYFHVVSATREEEAVGIATGGIRGRPKRGGVHAVERVRQHGQTRSPAYVFRPAFRCPCSSTCAERWASSTSRRSLWAGRRVRFWTRLASSTTPWTRTTGLVCAFRVRSSCATPRGSRWPCVSRRCSTGASLHRFSATKRILSHIEDLPVVSNLGPTTDELWHAGHRDRNFYTYGSMGLCSSIALGIALSTDEKVISLDGDGSLLMNMGTIATIGRESPSNLIVIVLGQRTSGRRRGIRPAILHLAPTWPKSRGAAASPTSLRWSTKRSWSRR